MKRTAAIILTALLLAGALASCKKNETAKAETDNVKASFEPVTVVDDENYTVTFSDYKIDELWGPTFVVNVENKTDKNISCSVNDVNVNGFTLDPWWSVTVAAGKKAENDMNWTESELEFCGINYIENVQLQLEIRDADDYLADAYFTAPVTLGVQSAGSGDAVTEPVYDFSEIVLCDTEELTLKVIGEGHDEIFSETYLIVRAENHSDKKLNYYADNSSVNGTMVTLFWSYNVLPGTVQLSKLSISDSDLEDCGVKNFENTEFELFVSEYENWGEFIFDEVVSF